MADKKSFFAVAITFTVISIVLLVISSQVPINARFWVNFPIIIFTGVLAIVYVGLFGFRKMEDALYDEEEELEEAVARLYEYKTRNKTMRADITEEEKLELLEMEELKEKIFREE